MQFVQFIQTPLGRLARIVAGLLLLAYGGMTLSLPGIVAMMAGVVSLVTGLAGLPQPPAPHNHGA